MFEIITFYIELVVFSCFLNLGFSLKIARNTRLGERVCSLEDDMRMVKIWQEQAWEKWWICFIQNRYLLQPEN